MITRTTLLCARTLPIQRSVLRRSLPRSEQFQSPVPNTVPRTSTSTPWRHYVSKSADEALEEIQELYATAKDEFEIASDETDKKTVYAADDRAAAKEELTRLKEAFEKATAESEGEIGKEVGRRVGSRIRELERAVEAMEERAMED